MKNTPIERHLIDETINEFQIVDFSKATIREVKAIASKAETASGVEFIKMEMGVPGLPPSAMSAAHGIRTLSLGLPRTALSMVPASTPSLRKAQSPANRQPLFCSATCRKPEKTRPLPQTSANIRTPLRYLPGRRIPCSGQWAAA